MLAKILGYIFIIAGAFFVLRPQILKNIVQKKALKKLKKYLILLAILAGVLLISVGWKFQGLLAKIVVIIGIISIFKAVFLLRTRLADRILKWSAGQPLIFFRIGGCLYILMGVIILLLR